MCRENHPRSRTQKGWVWPAAGLSSGILASMIGPKWPLSVEAAFAVAPVVLVMVVVVAGHPLRARAAVLVAGLLLAIPCLVDAAPVVRCLLMILMAIVFAAAAALVLVPPIRGLRARVAYLSTWCGTREVERQKRHVDVKACRELLAATAVLTAAIALVKAESAHGYGLLLRWFAGGVATLAFAEMLSAGVPLLGAAMGVRVPPLFRSPYRSCSLGEFWSRRWNILASHRLFHPYCYAPLARRGGVVVAVVATFALSALAHWAMAFMALGSMSAALWCGAFFLVQPPLLAAERRLKVRRWRRPAGHSWTLAALAVSSPLFVEPALQIVEREWGTPDQVVGPALAALGFVVAFSTAVSLMAFAAAQAPVNAAPVNAAPVNPLPVNPAPSGDV